MKRLAITAILMASVIGAHEAGATPINITANRLVLLGSDITGDLLGPNSPSTALGSFGDFVSSNFLPDDMHTVADQNSVVGASSFSGVGFSTAENFSQVFNEVSALSLFEVFFELTGNHSYSLGGELSADTGGGDTSGLALFDLSGPGGFSFSACCFIDQVFLSQTGTLGPGSYHLTVLSLGEAGAAGPFGGEFFGLGTYEFTFDLRSVPEPGSLALLVIGLAITAFRKRV